MLTLSPSPKAPSLITSREIKRLKRGYLSVCMSAKRKGLLQRFNLPTEARHERGCLI